MSRYFKYFLPFKGMGRVRVGMGATAGPHPHPNLLLRFKCALAPYGQGVSLAMS